MTDLERFRKFLADNDALEAYEDNIDDTSIEKFIKSVDMVYWFTDAFVWGSTKQGKVYWSLINRKWEKICDTI